MLRDSAVPILPKLLFPTTTFLAMMGIASASLHAQDVAPPNPKVVLQILGGIKAQRNADASKDKLKLAKDFMSASSNGDVAEKFFEDCVWAVQFAPTPTLSDAKPDATPKQKEFQAWLKKNDDRLKSQPFRTALCLHLMYISMTISHNSGVKVKDQIPDLVSYSKQVLDNADTIYGDDRDDSPTSTARLMRRPISDSMFVRWEQIGHYMTGDANWEPVPFNVDGIYEKIILPEYRLEKNSTAIFQYWDDRIAREAARSQKSGKVVDVDRFTNITKGSLLWERSQEYAAIGQPNRGITEMLAIIKAYPMHPDAPEWITTVEKIVNAIPTPAAPAPVATQPTPTPAPEATPAPSTENTASGSTEAPAEQPQN